MTVITISRGSNSRGKEVAEIVAKKLGYDCISRDVLLEASERFNIPEMKLNRAIHDAPSILERFTFGKEEYMTYVEAALLKYLREDNLVYHGLAGHFFVQKISHVLKVRIIADMKERIWLEMNKEKISREEAERIIKNDDEQRRKWSISLHGIDTANPSLYDLLIHIGNLSTEDAAEIICQAAKLKCFQTTPQSQKTIDDMALAAQVKASLSKINPHIEVTLNNDEVEIRAKFSVPDSQLVERLKEAAKPIAGNRTVNISMLPITRYTD